MTAAKPTIWARVSACLAAAAVLGALLWLAHALDPFVYRSVHLDNPLRRDWARMFRVFGYLPLWVLVALAAWMLDAGPARRLAWPSIRRVLWLLLNPALTGLTCELLKIAVRRERPESGAGAYVFRAWEGQWWSTSGLGFPSSHVGVAAGAAAALICLFPRAWPVWAALPLGCALTRLLEQDHYLSDCVGSIVGAIVVAAILIPLFRGRPR